MKLNIEKNWNFKDNSNEKTDNKKIGKKNS